MTCSKDKILTNKIDKNEECHIQYRYLGNLPQNRDNSIASVSVYNKENLIDKDC